MSSSIVKHYERRVSLAHLGWPDVHGTADVIFDQPFGILCVLDEKYGQKNVAPDSPQLKTYAIAAGGEYLHTYREVWLAITQPTKQPSLSIHKTTPKELMTWFHNELEPALKKIEAGDTTLNPTEEGCRYCKARNICPAYTEHAVTIAGEEFGQVLPPVINDDTVQKYYPQLSLLENWISDVRSHAHRMCERGDLNGYKMVNGRNSRKWINEEAALKLIEELGQDPYTRKPASPAQAEKLGKEVKTAIKDLIEVVPGKPTIAKEEDKRKALPIAGDEFKTIEN